MIILQFTVEQFDALVQSAVRKALSAEQPTNAKEHESAMLTLKEAAEYLHLAPSTLYSHTSKHLIPYNKRGGKLYFEKERLKEWLQAGKQKTQTEIETEVRNQFLGAGKRKGGKMQSNPNFTKTLQQDVKEKEKAFQGKGSFILDMIQTQNFLFEKASKEIIFSPPLVSWNGIGVFRKGTINVIQGKFGSHKSRLAELFCSLFLKESHCKTDFVGFEKDESTQFAVNYMDTERNLEEEIPATIQNIREKAGLSRTQINPHFYVTSIKKFERKSRLDSVKEWIEYLRTKESNPLFVVLDVVTDCVESFNSDGQSMELFDFLGNLCDDYGATFLLLIHENPGTEKARGHTGSEAANKASCVMQISVEDEEKGLIKLKFIKLRGAGRPQPIFMQYCAKAKGLVLAPDEVVQSVTAEKRKKTDIGLVKEQVELVLTKRMTQKELCALLTKYFDCSENTIKSRLRQLQENKETFINGEGAECVLISEWENGKNIDYFLQPQLPSLFVEVTT